MNTENRNMDGYDSLLESLKEIAGQMKGLTDMAVVQFTPWVNDICSRKATKNEVEHLWLSTSWSIAKCTTRKA